MKAFCTLYERLDATTSTLKKVEALVDYFREASPGSAAWALFFLTGRRLLRLVPRNLLRTWCEEATGIPDWLFSECYDSVGDLAETISLLWSTDLSAVGSDSSLEDWMTELLTLKNLDPLEQHEKVLHYWKNLTTAQIFLLNKLLTGAFRVGVSQTLVTRAIAQVAGLENPIIAHRLMGTWLPTAEFFTSLLSKAEKENGVLSQLYPFYLASPVDRASSGELGPIQDWQFEWKWDGIRAQLVKREGQIFLWSRGEELITERFPEIKAAAESLPNGTVLDGEILVFENNRPAPFQLLQTRIGRKKLSPSALEKAPARFTCYDILELSSIDLRSTPLSSRRLRLEEVLSNRLGVFQISAVLNPIDWDEAAALRALSRENQVEGLMIKRKTSFYQVGRKRGDWWKWKIDPLSLDAVLLYAQPGSGRRANLFTDYTFGIWKEKELVPIAKAYSGLTDVEILEMDRWIRQNTVQKFGPVRSVATHQVFELAFEGIQESPRHKSGIALRFPRIARWRRDKKPEEADTVDRVRELI